MTSNSLKTQRRTLEFAGESVDCDICGTNDFAPLGHRDYKVTGQTTDFLMSFDDATCKNCGFVCEQKRPSEDFLYEFYADAFDSYKSVIKIDVDYNVEARMQPIRKFLPTQSRILEIGAGAGHFCETLNNYGYNASGFDPKRQDARENLSTGFTREKNKEQDIEVIADAVVSYYVMEHVRRPATWLQMISRSLKDGGLMIIEVPDFSTHPYESLNFEHMSHFTPMHMEALLEQHGFEVIKERFPASRYFGFVAVGILRDRNLLNDPKPCVVSPVMSAFKAKVEALYNSAQSNISQLDSIADQTVEKIRQQQEQQSDTLICLWAVNDYSARIAERLKDKTSVYLLDNAESKIGQNFHGLANAVMRPDKDWMSEQNKIFVLCSPSANPAIQKQIETSGYKNFTIIDGAKESA